MNKKTTIPLSKNAKLITQLNIIFFKYRVQRANIIKETRADKRF